MTNKLQKITTPLRDAFNRSLDALDYVVVNYPSKAVGATGLAGDAMFFMQSVSSGNALGIAAASVGAYASVHLIRYGDPKITEQQKAAADYVDPQDSRNVISWIKRPDQYPWEYLGLLRVSSMGMMLGGGMAGSSYGEIAYASFALAGYAVKMGVAQKETGSVKIPEESHGLTRKAFQLNKFVQENPNTATGILWNAGIVPYAAEAVINQEHYKFASAVLWFLPTVLTMVSSKRAQTIDPPKGPDIS